MKNSTIRFISTLLTVVMLLTVTLEAPLMASSSNKIAVTVGKETINVTPGQWITVDNGGVKSSYNVRYVNGKAVALDIKQYQSLVFGTPVAQQAQQAQAPAAKKVGFFGKLFGGKSSGTAQQAQVKQDGFIKTEVKDFGSQIKSGYKAGQESGAAFKQTTGGVFGKIGNALSNAKNKVTGLFSKKSSTTVKTEKKGLFGKKTETQQPKAEKKGLFGFLKKGNKSSGKADQAAQTGKKQGLFSKVKDKTVGKFQSGFAAGKGMTQQGVQNVKTSLKSGFSPQNLLVTAGITVATDLGKQIFTGEKPSVKKALKSVLCAEFVGSTVGSVTGAAAGSFFTPFLTAIPVVGGALGALAPTFGSVVGSSVGAYLAGDLKNGKFSFKQAFANVDWTGVIGQTIGSTAGALLGSSLGPVGTIIGGMIGGYVGNWAAHKLKDLFGKKKPTNVTIGMPVGSVVAKPGKAVEIGTVGSTEALPVGSAGVYSPEIPVSAKVEMSGTYSSDLQMAEAKYKELYNLYTQMLSQGRQADAIKVAQEMNVAKAQYEKFKAQAGK